MQNKTVLITGASRGIGASTARMMAKAGANVILAARGGDALEALAKEIGHQALPVQCDVSKYQDVEHAVELGIAHFGALDVLIGNAGMISPVEAIKDADPVAWDKIIDVNLKGVFYGMRAALGHMIERGQGTIITISSGAAHHPLDSWSAYCASKAGAAMLTRSAHLENATAGLRIMGLSPGTVATEMQREIKESGINPVSQLDWSDHIPPEWPARALIWMCGSEADDFLGEEISLRDPAIRAKVGLI